MHQICPDCSSADVKFFDKKNRYTCNECGESFQGSSSEKKPLRIFISYGRDEYAALATQLKADLEARNHEVWFDQEKLKEGGDWEHYIDDGLNWVSSDPETGRILFIMTPHSVRRPDGYCLNEIAKALSKCVPIIPIMLVFSEPPLSIYRIQYLDMQDCYPPEVHAAVYEQRFDRLIQALEQEKLDFEGAQLQLQKSLKPIQFAADLSKFLRDFTGRKWVFDAVDDWFADPYGSKIFWLQGAPGVGKSSIAAWLRDNRRQIAAFHFCDINSEEKRDACKLVTSISYQLSTQLPEYQRRLVALNISEIIAEYTEAYTHFDKLIVQPLADNFPHPDRTIVILIDALDEASIGNKNDIALFLSLCASKTPSWLRFLVTSRPEHEIATLFQSLSPLILDTSSEANRADISEYLRVKLPGINDGQLQAILDRSEGVFLYARYVCEEICNGTLSLERTDEFPRGLGEVYISFFLRRFMSFMENYRKEIRPLLSLILASMRPLQLGFIMKILGYTNKMELFDCLDSLGSLFPRSGDELSDTITPFHRSLNDWLTSRARSGQFYIDKEYGHKILAKQGWEQFCKSSEDLDDYYFEWLPSHLLAAKEYDHLVQVLKEFCFMMARTRSGVIGQLLTDFSSIVKSLPIEHQQRLRIEESFFRSNGHILRRGNEDWPAYKILLQLAIEHADDSPLSIGAEKFLADEKCDWAWLRREKRPEYAQVDPYIAVFEGHSLWVHGAQMLADGRILSWSLDGTLRLWDDSGEPFAVMVGHRNVDGALQLPDSRILSWSSDGTLRLWSNCGEPLNVLEGHTSSVNGAVLLSDGRILSWSDDCTLSLWSNSGELIKVLTGHNCRIEGALQLPDGRILSWSDDNTLRLWRGNGDEIRTLNGHTMAVSGAQHLQDGRILSWAKDNTLRLWSACGEPLRILEGHTTPNLKGFRLPSGNKMPLWDDKGELVPSVVGDNYHKCIKGAHLLFDGRILSWSMDGTLRLWSATGEHLSVMNGHSLEVNGAQQLPDSRILSWSSDGTLRLWSNCGEPLNVLEGHTSSVNGAILLSDGRILSWSDDELQVWSDGGELLWVHPIKFPNSFFLLLPNDRLLSWSMSTDHTLCLWDIYCEPVTEQDGHTGALRDVKLLPDGRVLSFSQDKTLRLWSNTGDPLAVFKGHTDQVMGAELLPDGRILSWASDGFLHLWNDSGELLQVQQIKPYARALHLLPDGRLLFNLNICLQLFSANLEPSHMFKGHTSIIMDVYLLPDGRILSCSDDHTLRIWSASGKQLNILEGHTDCVLGAQLLADGRILSWAGDTLRLWSNSGEPITSLEGHTDWIHGALQLNDGRILSWAGDTLRLWSNSGEPINVLKGHNADISGASLLNDNRILSWAEDESIRLWSNEGIPLSEYMLNEPFKSEPIVWRQFLSENHKFDNAGIVTVGRKVNLGTSTGKQVCWHAQSMCKAHKLFADGGVFVTQENGQVCFLQTYLGNHRVTIDELINADSCTNATI